MLQLRFSEAGDLVSVTGAPVLMGDFISSSPIPRDPEMLDLLSGYSQVVRELQGTAVGVLGNALSGDRTVIRLHEGPLGSMVCDALVWYTEVRSRLAGE